MIVVSGSKGKHLGEKIARKLKAKHTNLEIKRFPDGELYLRFLKNVKNEKVILVQSFYGNIDELIVETLFAASTARDLGAKKVNLVAPYFPYFRQDKRFKEGECISLRVVGKLFDKYFDKIWVLDPHLHRQKNMKGVFNKGVKVSSNPAIGDYIKNNFKNPAIIGPDDESFQWAKKIAKSINLESSILKKTRKSSYNVSIRMKDKLDLKNKEVIIVDDIISTGHTILETIKKLKKLKPKKIICIGVHGVFVNKALDNIKKTGTQIITTNSIPSSVSKIDISEIIASKI